MKIWLDVRSFRFKNHLLFEEFYDILSKDENIEIRVYDDKNMKNIFAEQTIFFKKLLDDKNDIIISFEESFPTLYKKDFILILFWIENILFPENYNNSSFKKIVNNYITKKITKNVKEMICFSEKTKNEINEKLNISKNNIKVFTPFFNKNSDLSSNINIKNKHSLSWDYIIYDHNSSLIDLKKIINNIKLVNNKTNINIIFIWNELSQNLKIRQYIVEQKIQDKVIFTWEVWKKELKNYYKESLWVVIVWNYLNNIYSLSNRVYYDCPILAPNLENIIEIFQDKISYYNRNSIADLMEKILELQNKKEVNYNDIKEKYTTIKFIKNLKEIWVI